MKIVILLLLGAAVINAAVHRLPMMRTESIKSRMIKDGTYHHHRLNREKFSVKMTGQQPYIDYWDNLYLVNITLGTPPQSFSVIPDTGSSYLWAIDVACNTQNCIGQPQSGTRKSRFNPAASTTYEKQGSYFTVTYMGTNTVNGFFAYDNLQFAGIVSKHQEFGLAESVGDGFGYYPIDGILPLAWPAMSPGVTPPMQNILSQLDQPIFTVWLDKRHNGYGGQMGGLITYGAFDAEHCDSDISYVSISRQELWPFQLSGFQIGSYGMNVNQEAIADTGTPALIGPSAYVEQMIRQIGGYYDQYYNDYVVSCSKMYSAPDLIIYINNRAYTVRAADYITDRNYGNGECSIALAPQYGSQYGTAWILGDTFVRAYCNVYDIGRARVGFARAKHSY